MRTSARERMRLFGRRRKIVILLLLSKRRMKGSARCGVESLSCEGEGGRRFEAI